MKKENYPKNEENEFIFTGNRIPRRFFEVKGSGESDITIHAGSYHLALKKAGIEMANIITYSSILPGIAKKVPYQKVVHGSVLESIMAVSNTEKNERCSAGIIYGWLYDKKTNEKYGGLVCEHAGNEQLKNIAERLHASLDELYFNGFNDKFCIKGIHLITETFQPKKQYGTALVSLSFIDYVTPILNFKKK